MGFSKLPDEAVERMTKLSAGAWRLYCYLLYCRNRTTGQCNPSVRTCAEALDVHPKHIPRLRRELVAKEWARFDGDRATALFGVENKNVTSSIDTIEDAAPSKNVENKNVTAVVDAVEDAATENKNVPDTPAVGTKMFQSGTKMLPDGNKNVLPYKEEPEERTRRKNQKDMSNSRSTAGAAAEVFDYWKKTLNHPRSIFDPKRKRLIDSRLEDGFSVEDLKMAVDGCKASDWYMGENDRHRKFDSVGLIFRNAEKVEEFIGLRPGGNGNGNGSATLIPKADPHCRECYGMGYRLTDPTNARSQQIKCECVQLYEPGQQPTSVAPADYGRPRQRGEMG